MNAFTADHVYAFEIELESGNVFKLATRIPSPGKATDYCVLWRRRATAADRLECRYWKDRIAEQLSEISGRAHCLLEEGEPLPS